MKLFTQDIEKVQEHIEDAINQLSRLKSIEKFMDVLSFINCLNENIIYCNDKSTYNLNKERINSAYSTLKNVLGYGKIKSRYRKNFNSIAENYGTLSSVSTKILHGIDEEIIVDENLLKKEEYTNQEMANIIKKYYIKQHDFESLELFCWLESKHFIYDIDLGEKFSGQSTTSRVLDKDFILVSNHHNFNTIVNLIHEVRHIKEWKTIDKLHRLQQYRENSNLTEVGPEYAERVFLEYTSNDSKFREQAINRHYMNYRNLKQQLEAMAHLFSQDESLQPSIDEMICYMNSICGNIFSDILLSTTPKVREQFFESIKKRRNLFLDSFDFKAFTLTTYGAADKVVKQYQKYK